MRIVIRIIGLLVLLLVVVVGLSVVASEAGGEVVVLTTKGASGTPHETRVWVVDEGGIQWLRADSPQSSWLVAIQRDPAVEVERAGKRAAYNRRPRHRGARSAERALCDQGRMGQHLHRHPFRPRRRDADSTRSALALTRRPRGSMTGMLIRRLGKKTGCSGAIHA